MAQLPARACKNPKFPLTNEIELLTEKTSRTTSKKTVRISIISTLFFFQDMESHIDVSECYNTCAQFNGKLGKRMSPKN